MRRSRGNYRRYTRRIKTIKYSNETTGSSGTWTILNNDQNLVLSMITPSNAQGTRKCKNFELSLCGSTWTGEEGAYSQIPVLWALVYVPEGTSPSSLRMPDPNAPGSIYEPNQNVIMSGLWPGNLTSNYKVKTRLARNLNSGDSIYLVMRTTFDIPNNVYKQIVASLNYAIAY